MPPLTNTLLECDDAYTAFFYDLLQEMFAGHCCGKSREEAARPETLQVPALRQNVQKASGTRWSRSGDGLPHRQVFDNGLADRNTAQGRREVRDGRLEGCSRRGGAQTRRPSRVFSSGQALGDCRGARCLRQDWPGGSIGGQVVPVPRKTRHSSKPRTMLLETCAKDRLRDVNASLLLGGCPGRVRIVVLHCMVYSFAEARPSGLQDFTPGRPRGGGG